MKEARTVCTTMVLLFALSSCEEFVNPKVEVKGIPVLYCIIPASGSGTASTVQAELTRVYDVDGLDPSANRTDPFIPGAVITLSYRMRLDTMRAGNSPRSDTSRYTTRKRFYWTTLAALNPGDTVSLTAKTPQGEVLTASAQLPQFQNFKTSIDFPTGFTTMVPNPSAGQSWTLSWNEEEDHIFFPKLRLWYRKYSDTVGTLYSREIALSYVRQNGIGVPVYPSYVWGNSASFAFSSFDSAMTQISAGDPDKHQYKIDFLTFSLTECDRSLSRYYSSVRGYLDDYSVRLDESIYTNVGGGIGVFGSYRTTSLNYPVDLGYVRSFGYQ